MKQQVTFTATTKTDRTARAFKAIISEGKDICFLYRYGNKGDAGYNCMISFMEHYGFVRGEGVTYHDWNGTLDHAKGQHGADWSIDMNRVAVVAPFALEEDEMLDISYDLFIVFGTPSDGSVLMDECYEANANGGYVCDYRDFTRKGYASHIMDSEYHFREVA